MAKSPPIRAEVRAEAAVWLARLRTDNRSERDEQLFREWLAADPEHGAAFEAVNNLWETAGALPRDSRRSTAEPALPTRRRALLAGMAGIGSLVVAGAAGTMFFLRPASAEIYETAVGEQKNIFLSDGSRVFLDTDSKLSVELRSGLRSALLQKGCANFRVAADRGRPFSVTVGTSCIKATDGEFNVRRDNAGCTSFVLVHGRACVNFGRRSANMKPGQRLIWRTGDRVALDRPNLAPLLAWQSGQAIFQNVKLSDAISEMNRYSATKLDAGDSWVANLRISGVYAVGDNSAFVRSVSQLLPIDARQINNRIYLMTDGSRR